MTDPDQELMNRVARLDPAPTESAPAVGSTRFHTAKDHVMATTVTASQSQGDQPAQDHQPPAQNHRPAPRRRTLLVGLAASVIAIAAVGFALVGPGTTPSAEAQVRAAVDGSIEVVDFRITIVSDNSLSIPGGRAEGEVDGANLHLAAPGIEMYLVDGIEWIVVDGEVVSSGPAEETLPPYGEASQKVIHAALASNSVVDGGAEVLNGVETNRFLIEIDDAAHAALRALPPETTRWFTEDTEEEIVVDSDGNETAGTYRSGFLEEADSLVIWIADDLVHQISVDSGNSQFTHTFYDFGADITVTAPE